MICGGQMFAVKKKEIGDLAMGGNETLALPCRLEPHHAPFASSQRQV